MKLITIAATFLVAQAFAYNQHKIPVLFGMVNLVDTSKSQVKDAKVVSFEVELNTQSGKYPLVQIDNGSKNCSHKQTLITYSGYDLATRTYKRVYEVQVERDPSKSCFIRIFASTSKKDQDNAARIALMPVR